MRKAVAEKHWQELRDLLCEWDPIGVIVPGCPGSPWDEYDHEMPWLVAQLEQGCSEDELVLLLNDLIQHHFGVPPEGGTRPSRTRALARGALAWFERWRATLAEANA